jgi:uncharacterized protein DUF6788
MAQVGLEELERRQGELKAQLSNVQDMRRGSLVARYRKCGKARCCCANEHHAGHGPSLSLTWQDEGKTRTKIIPVEAAERTKAQIAEFRRFRRLCRELVEVSERICDARLENEQAEAQATAKKGGSKKSSRHRSSRRSRP